MLLKKNGRNIFYTLAWTVCLSLLLSVTAFAAARTVNVLAAEDGTVLVSVTDSVGNGSLSSGTLTIQAKGGYLSQTTNTVTIKNASSDEATITFDYTASNYSSFSLTSASGTHSVTLAAGAETTITIKGKKAISSNTATLKLSNFSYIKKGVTFDITTKFDSTYGSIKVGSTQMNSDIPVAVEPGTITLQATAKTGGVFLGWQNSAGKFINFAAEHTITITEDTKDTNFIAVFKDSGKGWFLASGTTLYDDLNAAGTFAATQADKTVILLNNTTLPAGSYTIPTGVTFLIPYNSTHTIYTEDNVASATMSYSKPSFYRVLTMADGAHITVNGIINVGGRHAKNMPNNGSPSGALGRIKMSENSSITVNSGGKLYAWGYITGSGSVTAKSGSTVYENFQIKDWRGGDGSSKMVGNWQLVFPVSQYYVQNIEVPLTLENGTSEKLVTSLSIGLIGDKTPVVEFIGEAGGLFQLSSGKVIKDYNESNDRLEITVDGNITLGNMAIEFTDQYMIDSAEYILPLSNNITINVDGGTATVNQHLALLPGVQTTIASGASLVLGSVGGNPTEIYVYDSESWIHDAENSTGYCGSTNKIFVASNYAPGRDEQKPPPARTVDNLADAAVCVNGLVDASSGYLYTTGNGANIYSTDKGVIKNQKGTKTKTYQAIQGSQTILGITSQTIDYVDIPVTPAKLRHEDDTYLESGAGTYSHDHYSCIHESDENPALHGKWVEGSHTEVIDAAVAATCTETGLTEGKHCSVCGEVIVAQTEVAALGHTEVIDAAVAATCTETGLTEGKHCSVCGEVIVAQTEVAALGHTEAIDAAAAPTCTETGLTEGKHCSVCNEVLVAQTEVAALGHTEVIDPAVAATCTTAGKTEGKHCSVCNAVLIAQTEVAALGHTEVIDAAVAATCTETGLTEGKHCSVCNAVLVAQTEVAKLPHTEETIPGTEATCTTPGLTDGVQCSVCNEILTPQTEIPALGHTEVIDAAVTATCTTVGKTEGKHCSVCNEVLVAQEEVPPLGHSYTAVVTAPTCVAQGYTTHTCTVCGDSYVDAYVDPTGVHTYGENNKCTVCGKLSTAQVIVPGGDTGSSGGGGDDIPTITPHTTLQSALNAVDGTTGSTITLNQNVTAEMESAVTLPPATTVTIDLAGNSVAALITIPEGSTLQGINTGSGNATITVVSGSAERVAAVSQDSDGRLYASSVTQNTDGTATVSFGRVAVQSTDYYFEVQDDGTALIDIGLGFVGMHSENSSLEDVGFDIYVGTKEKPETVWLGEVPETAYWTGEVVTVGENTALYDAGDPCGDYAVYGLLEFSNGDVYVTKEPLEFNFREALQTYWNANKNGENAAALKITLQKFRDTTGAELDLT